MPAGLFRAPAHLRPLRSPFLRRYKVRRRRSLAPSVGIGAGPDPPALRTRDLQRLSEPPQRRVRGIGYRWRHWTSLAFYSEGRPNPDSFPNISKALVSCYTVYPLTPTQPPSGIPGNATWSEDTAPPTSNTEHRG